MRRLATAALALLTLAASVPTMCEQCQFVRLDPHCEAKTGGVQGLPPVEPANTVMPSAQCEHQKAAGDQSRRDKASDPLATGGCQHQPCRHAEDVATRISSSNPLQPNSFAGAGAIVTSIEPNSTDSGGHYFQPSSFSLNFPAFDPLIINLRI